MACITSQFAQCVEGKWALTPCAEDLKCFALPLVNKAGTSIVCDTQDDALARFAATGVSGGTTGKDATSSTPSASDSASSPTPTDDGDCDDDDTDNGPSGTDDDDCDDDDSTPKAPEGTPISVKSATPTVLAASTAGYGSDNASPTTITLLAAPESTGPTPIPLTTITLARRQILTLNTPSSSATPTVPAVSSSSVETLATVAIPSSVSASTPVITPTTSSSSIGSVVTPTVVIGTDGFVTVTVVSTSIVTVSATGCSAPTVPTLAPVPVISATPSSSIGSASPSASGSPTIGASPLSLTFSLPNATPSPATPAAQPTGSTLDPSALPAATLGSSGY